MASCDKPEVVEREVQDREPKEDNKDDEKGGFLEKVKDFIHDVDAGTIHAHGSETVKIPVCLIYDDIKSTYNDIKPGSIIPYKVKVDLIVDVPVFGRLTLPLEKTGEIPIPYKPDIDLEKIHFDKFSFEETIATLHVKLENMNDFDLGLNGLDCEVWLSDVSIGGTELAKSVEIKKKGISYVDIPITFRPKDFGSALWDMIRGRGTGYTLKGHINVDTPFGGMKLPISREGGTTRLKKKKEDRCEMTTTTTTTMRMRSEELLEEGRGAVSCFWAENNKRWEVETGEEGDARTTIMMIFGAYGCSAGTQT
ncbi:hypothetical protein Sango_0694200 [Sesamum angolense]|uniref:Water stress and hypersensitive response domain-containing protein n=1 Tax=Sesamum angolense TaxID=2727404 RepID=A0AAE1X187_9LAMI|nr:hypothetical protein Sango_0694200 [Sesamum angolense]